VVIHPSDEFYGADRVLLEALSTVPPGIDLEVWLPTDVAYPDKLLSKALKKRGIRVKYLALPIVRRSYLRISSLLPLAVRFVNGWRMLHRVRPDIVYINTAAGALLVPLSRLVGARTVVHLHEYLEGFGAGLIKPFLLFAHHLIAVSHAIVLPLPGRLAAKTEVIYNGFTLGEPSPHPEGDQLVVVIASRWNWWKGHDVLFQAWATLKRNDIRLMVLGAQPVSGASVDVRKLVENLPNRSTVEVVGQVVDVRAALNEAHVVVVPSSRPDPLPTIAIEAMAAGRMVLASDSGGLPEIVGQNGGRLVPPDDVLTWAAMLESLTIAEAKISGVSARKRYEQLFSVQEFRAKISHALWG